MCVLAMGSVRSCPDLVYSKKKKTRIGKRKKKKNKRDCDHAVHTQLHTRVLLLFSSVVFASIPPSLRRSLPYHSSIHIHCVCMHGSTSLSLSLLSFLVVVAVLWDDDKSQDKKYETRRSLSLSPR